MSEEAVRKWAHIRIEVTVKDLKGWTGVPPTDDLDGFMAGCCPACKHDTREPLYGQLLTTLHRSGVVSDNSPIIMLDTRNRKALSIDTASDWAQAAIEELDRRPAPAPQPQPAVQVDLVHCRCRKAHLGRDKDDKYGGCGRYWLAELARSADDDSSEWTVRPGDPAYWPQAELVDVERKDQLTTAKSTAESWATTMVALLGVLGISGLVLSREVAQKIDALPRSAVFACLVLSAFCAWKAHRNARLAATGVPVLVPISHPNDPHGAAAVAARAIPDIIGSTRVAERWAAAAVAFVALGTFVLWFAGPAQVASTQVRITPGDTCGALVDSEERGTLGIRQAKGMDPTKIRLSDITRVDIVDACPPS